LTFCSNQTGCRARGHRGIRGTTLYKRDDRGAHGEITKSDIKGKRASSSQLGDPGAAGELRVKSSNKRRVKRGGMPHLSSPGPIRYFVRENNEREGRKRKRGLKAV